jgi:hypothetical protein
MDSNRQQLKLVLNALDLHIDSNALVRVGRVNYVDSEGFEQLRRQLGSGYVVRRCGTRIEIAAVRASTTIPAEEIVNLALGDITDLLARRLSDWLIEHFAPTGRQLFKRQSSLGVLSNRADDDLLLGIVPQGASLPPGIAFRAAFVLDVRVERPFGKPQVFLVLNVSTHPCIDTPVAELLAAGLTVHGLYVRRHDPNCDSRLADLGRLTGRVEMVDGHNLILTDHEKGWSEIPASEARLEPRMEILARLLSQLCPAVGLPRDVLQKLRLAAGRILTGREQLKRIRSMADYLRRQRPLLLDDQLGKFGELVANHNAFPKCEVISKPALIFDVSGNRTNRWSQGGLDRYGPFDRYQFSPKRLNIAVVCRHDLQGQVEQFVEQFLHGIPENGADIGFLRRFALEKPYVQIFVGRDGTPGEYRRASIAAIEHITDRGDSWNLALVQTEQAMEALTGDENPYLTTKAFFLSHGIAVQHVHFETMNQNRKQLVYSLNNMGLACYAKLGGVPWLLPLDQTVAHELVIGLGSHHEKKSRFGVGDRYVGITTVFSGDGRYLLESRTRAVPFSEYGSAMLDAISTAITQVRDDYAWSPDDPVRLVFHAFKPLKDVEAESARTLISKLNLPYAEYAFLHVADDHPFRLFDENEVGHPASDGSNKGIAAPPRGLMVHLSQREALLCLKGARELKQAIDGHPAPLLLRLHPNSTFRDITYLGRQAYAFACHSWRSFLPAPMPITILYSQLVAESLRELSTVSGWSDDAIVGRVGRTRWFL